MLYRTVSLDVFKRVFILFCSIQFVYFSLFTAVVIGQSERPNPEEPSLSKVEKPYFSSAELQAQPHARTFQWKVEPGKSIFIGFQDLKHMKQLHPVCGYTIRSDRDPRDFVVEFSLIPPVHTDKNRWKYVEGAFNQDKGFGSSSWDFLPEVDKGESIEHFTDRELQIVPVDIKGVEIYLLPLRRVDGQIQHLLIAITKNKSILQRLLNVKKRFGFNWENWFVYPPQPENGSK